MYDRRMTSGRITAVARRRLEVGQRLMVIGSVFVVLSSAMLAWAFVRGTTYAAALGLLTGGVLVVIVGWFVWVNQRGVRSG